MEKIKLPKAFVDEVENLLRSYHIEPIPISPSDVEIRDLDDRWVFALAFN